MATKKDYLRAAILSGGAEGSSEHPSAIVAIQPSNGYVAPANGAVYFNGKANGTGGTAMSIVKNGGLSSAFTAQVDSTWFNSVSLRVRKGDVISFGSYNLSDVHVYFVSLVGGGKNSVAQSLWRVVPCLRNCLARVLARTLKAKRTGSGSNLFRLPQPSNINGHRAIGMKSFLLKRGGFPFELRLLGTLKSLNLVLLRTIRPFQCQPSPGTMDTSERPFLLGKGSRSNSRSQGTSLRPVFTSGFIGLRAEPNLCFGGASHG